MKHIILLSLAAMALACSGNRQASAGDPGPDPEPAAAATPAPAVPQLGGAAPADSLFMSLERTPCFGPCKAYRIDLYRSGYAVYDGRLNMEKEGRHAARIGADTLRTILALAEEKGFFAMQDKYDAEVTDLPSTFLRIAANGKDKRVMGRVGQPPAFKQLVADIEALLLPVPWKPLQTEP